MHQNHAIPCGCGSDFYRSPTKSRDFWNPTQRAQRSRAAKRGGFKRGGFPIWTCPSFFVLFRPFWDFPDFSGIFPICSGMVRGFSRFVLFLFLGLLRAPTNNSPERVRDTICTFPEKSGKHPGLETPRFSFSQPKDQKHSRFRARLKISSENEIFERATHHGPTFCGEMETSRLKIFGARFKF